MRCATSQGDRSIQHALRESPGAIAYERDIRRLRDRSL
jgi:hypothetical protein